MNRTTTHQEATSMSIFTNDRPSTTERQLLVAIERGDRIAAVNLAQRLWLAGDVRRTAVVALFVETVR